MKTVDLFSGCGGLTLGLENAGFDVVLAVDNWDPAIAIYKRNFAHPIKKLNLLDVAGSVTELKKYSPEFIVGGPPCQDYSAAGNRNEERGRADLTISFANIISKIKPQFFLMENVDQIVKSKRYAEALKIFKKAGYGLTAITLDASLCGAPQKRKRHFVIGSRSHVDNFLMETIVKKMADKPMTVRDYLGNKLGIDFYYRHPRNYSRRAIYTLDEPSPTIRGVNRPIASGYPGHHLDASKDYSKVRPLTTTERSYIQTFPENFYWVGPKTHVEQAIGNAVPVKLAEFVGSCLIEFLHGKNRRIKSTKVLNQFIKI